MVRWTDSKTPFRLPTPLNRETWTTFCPLLRSIYQQTLRLLKRSHSEHRAPLKKSLPTKHFFKSSATSLLGPTSRCWGWIRPLLKIISIPSLMWYPFIKSRDASTIPKLLESKQKLTNYAQLVSSTRLLTPRRFATLSL